MKRVILLLTLLTSLASLFGQSILGRDSVERSLKARSIVRELDHADNIVQFNRDTILVAGYLSNEQDHFAKNTVLQTFDGGKTWKANAFKGDAWIYNTCFHADGKVWMGGSDEFVHYSTDFGTNWVKIQKPFSPANRILSIYMADSLNGIAGGLWNGLVVTHNNWKNVRAIPSPLDQRKYNTDGSSSNGRTRKLLLVDSIMLVNQNDHVYYSKLNPVEWKAFNIPVRDFSFNRKDSTIELTSIGRKYYVLDAKLNLLRTYFEPDSYLDQLPENNTIAMDNFLAAGIRSLQIKGVKYELAGNAGGCIPFAVYKENAKVLHVKRADVIKEMQHILSSYDRYEKPVAHAFSFSQQDLANYREIYRAIKVQRAKEKGLGEDFTYLMDVSHKRFLAPGKIVDSLSQQLLDSVYKIFANPLSFPDNTPYVLIKVVNNRSDTLTIKSSNLYSLPWQINYQESTFATYDTRLIKLLKGVLPKGFHYSDRLLAGELIYRLIEQRITNEMTYTNGL